MNLENDKEYLSAISDLDIRTLDGKIYMSVEELDDILTGLMKVIEDDAKERDVCPHEVVMYHYIMTVMTNLTDTIISTNASAIVPDTIPDDII